MATITSLTCEYCKNPMGIDCTPRFTWQIAAGKGIIQGAYRIIVCKKGSDEPVWDSGKVNKRDSVLIPYEGEALAPRTEYMWKVCIWDKKGRDVGFSETAGFETGLLSAGFSAAWISPAERGDIKKMEPAPRLRNEFTLKKGIVKARLYASALGVYELRLNGEKVGNAMLTPGWTSYDRCVQYQTYDVTKQLNEGENAMAATLADGWYRGLLAYKDHRNIFGDRLALIAQLYVRYEDGSEQIIKTNSDWKTNSDTPIRYCDYYMGTHYDANLETEGWDKPGFDDSGWQKATELLTDKHKPVSQIDHPVTAHEILKPVQLIKTPKGETVLDFGQNMVGYVRFNVRGEKGHTVTVRHAEVLDKDGNFYMENSRLAEAKLMYTLKGEGTERYEPILTFYGFRYIRLDDWCGDIDLNDFEGVVIHSDIEQTSGFECSDERVNRLFHNIIWGQKGNFVDVPTDCPQRDERLGWTGDCQAFAHTACINMDSALMLSEWMKDLSFDQRSDGAVPHVIPHVLNDDCYGSAAWGDAVTIVPWTLYQCYGDKRVLEESYPAMCRWLSFIKSQSEDYLWSKGVHFGDWLGLDAFEGSYLGSTDKTLIATAYWAYSTRLTMKTAEVLGYEKDAQKYKNLLRKIRAAYRKEFMTPNGRLAVNTQTAFALTLYFDLADEADRPRLARDFEKLIENSGNHLTTGFVGTPYLCMALSENGLHDVAGKLFLREEYPSWLYSVRKGATTMWEHWDGIKPDGSFWSRDMNSYNHYAYGAIGEWMFRALAGIDMSEPAYGELVLHPRPIDGLSFVSAWQKTPYGRVRIEWRIEDGQMNVNCKVPGGVTAMLVLEDAELYQVTENGRILTETDGVIRAWQSENDVMVELESGMYSFKWSIK